MRIHSSPGILILGMPETDTSKENLTVINTAPSNNSGGNNGYGFLLWVVILGILAVLFFVYALPYIRNLSTNNGVQVNVPESIDINVNQSE